MPALHRFYARRSSSALSRACAAPALALWVVGMAGMVGMSGICAAQTAQTAAPAADPALARAAAEKGAVVTASGLVFTPMKAGSGARPAATDTVRVHYRGTFTDGREFDSSYSRGQPATFPLNRVIPCWTEGVQRLQVGGKAKLTCPSAIAYGERGRPSIPPNSVLQFEVELLGIESR